MVPIKGYYFMPAKRFGIREISGMAALNWILAGS
jgi:hypothetical protein